MKLLHSYSDDLAVTTLHHGYERLAIEAALRDADLQRRDRMRSAMADRLTWGRRPS